MGVSFLSSFPLLIIVLLIPGAVQSRADHCGSHGSLCEAADARRRTGAQPLLHIALLPHSPSHTALLPYNPPTPPHSPPPIQSSHTSTQPSHTPPHSPHTHHHHITLPSVLCPLHPHHHTPSLSLLHHHYIHHHHYIFIPSLHHPIMVVTTDTGPQTDQPAGH